MMGKVIEIPYCSSKFVFNEENFGAAYHWFDEPMIARQKRVNQLQRLTHPNGGNGQSGYFWFPFPQSRFDHAIKIPPIAKIILSKAGFSQRYIQQFILTVLTHDAPTPCGGDATMRLDKQRLCEVVNYKLFMTETGLSEKFSSYGYDVDEAASLVAGQGATGSLVKFLDWLSYTALDAFHLGKRKPREIQNLLKKYPFIADVWRDIGIAKERVFFLDANRLYNFLKLRALMHSEFYLNPDCRRLEHVFFSETKKLFESEKISLDDLRFKDDHWLDLVVRDGKDVSWCTQPEDVSWQRFETEQEADGFYAQKKSAFYKEHIKPFKTGMNLLVMHERKIKPLYDALSKKHVQELEQISNKRAGWYVYYFK
ncbi:MAG: hypothetical protein ACD_9C00175G0003 [uncultured bacterium]|nr:MAG: hypothetical protein ACD_9C00175G0003 [uncultured bacterium]